MLAALQGAFQDTLRGGCCSDPGGGAERAAVVSVDNKPVAAPSSEGIRASPRPGGDEQRVFLVKLRGTVGKLGLDLEYLPERSVIPIKYVKGFAAGDWNAANPDFAIQAGDCIVAVGSVKGHAEAMKNALANRDATELQMTIARLAPQLDPQDEAFVDAYTNMPCIDPDQHLMQSPRVASAASPRAAPQDPAILDQEALLQEAQADLPPPWQPVWSRSQSKYYFYNPHTNQSVWVKPTESSPRADSSPLASPRKGGAASSSQAPATPAPHRMQTPRVGGGSSNNVAETSALAASNDDDGTEVGLWQYSDGTYKIYRKGDQLIYEEESFGVYGVLSEAEDGTKWLEADLTDSTGGKGPAALRSKDGGPIGRVRVRRDGDTIVSNFRPNPGAPWESDVVAERIGGA